MTYSGGMNLSAFRKSVTFLEKLGNFLIEIT